MYGKPTSLFPAVFRRDILRQAGLEDMMIFDSQTYMLAALYGDVYIMPGIVGTYRRHPESNTSGRKSAGYNQRRYANLAERIRQDEIIRDGLYKTADKKSADKCHVYLAFLDTSFFVAHSRSIADKLNIFKTLCEHSSFSKLRIALIMLDSILRVSLKKIPGLRKLVRFIKYREKF